LGRRRRLATQIRVVGAEVVGVGAFVLLLLWAEGRAAGWNSLTVSFGTVFAIVGITLVLVGLEAMWLGSRVESETKTA
jgi:hypothetical protein